MNATTPRLLEAIEELKAELATERAARLELSALVEKIPAIQSIRLEQERVAAMERDAALCRMSKDERNAELLKRADLRHLFQKFSGYAVRWILEAPDADTQERWLALVGPDTRDRVLIEQVEVPDFVVVHGNREINFSWQPTYFGIDRETEAKLLDAGLHGHVGSDRAGFKKFYPFTVTPASREVYTRDQLQVLREVWARLDEEITNGRVVVSTMTKDESKAMLLDQWSRTPVEERRSYPPKQSVYVRWDRSPFTGVAVTEGGNDAH